MESSSIRLAHGGDSVSASCCCYSYCYYYDQKANLENQVRRLDKSMKLELGRQLWREACLGAISPLLAVKTIISSRISLPDCLPLIVIPPATEHG